MNNWNFDREYKLNSERNEIINIVKDSDNWQELLTKCCVCGQPYGLVWDSPGYRNQWVHFGCSNFFNKDAQQ